jgi:hypothetical protein
MSRIRRIIYGPHGMPDDVQKKPESTPWLCGFIATFMAILQVRSHCVVTNPHDSNVPLPCAIRRQLYLHPVSAEVLD